MVDVFVSYARENQAFAQRIAEGARREGYTVWWDDDLPPHLSYGEVITEKIGAAGAVIVVWSREAAASEWVRAEADLARSQKKLIQTSVDDAQPPMPFNQIQFASIADWRGESDHPGWNKVKGSLAALSGRAPSQVTTPPAAPHAPPARPAVSAGGNRMLPLVLGLILLVGGGILWLRAGADELPADHVQPVAEQDSSPDAPVAAETPRPSTALFTQAAVIDDPDGFTNVRSGPSASFPIVARVNRGDVFTTYPQVGDWWQVRTADSRVGYMARSRIRVIEPDGGAPVATASVDPAEAAPLPPPAAAVPAASPSPQTRHRHDVLGEAPTSRWRAPTSPWSRATSGGSSAPVD